MQYTALMVEDTSFDTHAVLQAVLDSIEKRWKKTEQEAFIVSVILNPTHKLKPFNRVCRFTTLAGAIALLKKLYKRFFGALSTDDDQAFYEEATEYLNNVGHYRDLSEHAEHISTQARRLVSHLYFYKKIPSNLQLIRASTPIRLSCGKESTIQKSHTHCFKNLQGGCILFVQIRPHVSGSSACLVSL
jgi:hypothetical protein